MAYVWSKALETGHAAIDTQHKQLVETVNNLLDACSKGKGRDEIKKVMGFLLQYTVKHFADEERLQQSSGYPDYLNHKKIHTEFTQTAKNLAAELEEKGPSIVMVGKINKVLGDWLIQHIQKEDMKIAKYIQEKSK
ncbi:MAG: bacteriohemerythrin [Oscillospiraceae bacterium]|nr:bacteriohemerythrin [Oscillospiraceae bacterium]